MSGRNRDVDEPATGGAGTSRAATLLLVGAVLGGAVVLFAWMNTDPVSVTVFLWEPEISKALLMFGPLAAGFVLGWALRASRARGRSRRDAERGGEGKWEPGPEEGAGGGRSGAGGGSGDERPS